MRRRLSIAIVGYGTAGQAARLYLQRAGHEIEQFEQAPRLEPVGAGFLLQPTGLSVLDNLGLGDAARACGARIARLSGENERGRRIMEMRYAELASDLHGLGMQRGALFNLLRSADATAQSVRTDARIAAIDVEAGTLRDERGHGHGPFDLIVLAAGAHSPLRAILGDAVRAERLYPWGAIWCLADDLRGRFGCDLEQRYRRAREMVGVLPVGSLPGESARKVSIYWSVRVAEQDATFAAGIGPLRERFAALWPDAAALLDGMQDLSCWRKATYRDVAVNRPYRGRVVLIGDIAHGMSPQLGQGVNMALLDAQALAHALATNERIDRAFAAYADTRAAHLRIYQRLSRWLTPLFQSDRDAFAWWRDLLFLPASRFPLSRGESLKVLTGIKRGWFGRLKL